MSRALPSGRPVAALAARPLAARLRPAPLALLLALLLAVLPACVVVDVRGGEGEQGVRSHGFISGYATAGWPADDSFLKVALIDGPSPGGMLYVQLWKLLRVEVGIFGAALGVGPLDAGFGILLYDPQPPRYEGDEPRSQPATPPTEPEAKPDAKPEPAPAPKP